MQFLHVPGVSDYAKPIPELAMDAPDRVAFPFLSTGSALRMRFSKLNTQPTDASVYASAQASRPCAAKLEVKVVRYSFLVGLFHPLLHAGLSRRTDRL